MAPYGPTDLMASGKSRAALYLAPSRLPRAIPRRTTQPQPDFSRLGHALGLVVLEVEAGVRPWTHLEAIVSPTLAPLLHRHLRSGALHTVAPTMESVVAVHQTWPHDRQCELAIIVRRRAGVGVLTARIVHDGSKWTLDQLSCPEHLLGRTGGPRNTSPQGAVPALEHNEAPREGDGHRANGGSQ